MKLAECMEQVARKLLGTPNPQLSKDQNWRFGAHGSLSVNLKNGTWYDHERQEGGGVLKLIERRQNLTNGAAIDWLRSDLGINLAEGSRQVVAVYDYKDENGNLLFRVVRYEPKDFRQCRPDGRGWIWNLNGVRRVPFHLPRLLVSGSAMVFVVEGEKDVQSLERLGLIATCNPGGAGKWRDEFAPFFQGKNVVILPDNDTAGNLHATDVARKLRGVAASIRIVRLLSLRQKGDVSDWIAAGGTAENLARLSDEQEPQQDGSTPVEVGCPVTELDKALAAGPVDVSSFYAYMPGHNYIFLPTGELWPAASVNARLPKMPNRDGVEVKPNVWLDQNRSVEQMTWAPGLPKIIRDRLIESGGWIEAKDCAVFNLYRSPVVAAGDPAKAEPWIKHVRNVYPDEADHLIKCFAHRVQRPGEKLNHALLLGGDQGIGKDSILEPVKHAVGHSNFWEVSPMALLGRFTPFAKSVILRINEARDLGEANRFAFYDRLKTYAAAPPDVLLVDEKNKGEYYVPNVCGVIITTNYKLDGLYLPADDRRHFVAWSERKKEDFLNLDPLTDDRAGGYFAALWRWFDNGGIGHVVAYIREYDLSGFDPKAPPPKTQAFWDIVAANGVPEDAEMADAIDALGKPDALTIAQIAAATSSESFRAFLLDRKCRRQVPHRLEKAGYVVVRNDAAADGLWKIDGKRQVIYAHREIAPRDRIIAARNLVR